jgi:hypothetical protein
MHCSLSVIDTGKVGLLKITACRCCALSNQPVIYWKEASYFQQQNTAQCDGVIIVLDCLFIFLGGH